MFRIFLQIHYGDSRVRVFSNKNCFFFFFFNRKRKCDWPHENPLDTWKTNGTKNQNNNNTQSSPRTTSTPPRERGNRRRRVVHYNVIFFYIVADVTHRRNLYLTACAIIAAAVIPISELSSRCQFAQQRLLNVSSPGISPHHF